MGNLKSKSNAKTHIKNDTCKKEPKNGKISYSLELDPNYVQSDDPPSYDNIAKNDSSVNNDDMLKEEFRKRIITKQNDINFGKTYVDNLIAKKLGMTGVDRIISPYDPYILRWSENAYDDIKKNYDKGSNIPYIYDGKYYYLYYMSGLYNIDLCKNIIDNILDNNNAHDYRIAYGNVQCMNNDFIKEVLPGYHNVLTAWKVIITINRIYMEAWEPNGELCKIFGGDCKPFDLRFVVMNKNKSSKVTYSKKDIYKALIGLEPIEDNNYLKSCVIKRLVNGLPNFKAVSNSIANMGNGDEFIFYIDPTDIVDHVNKRKKYIESNV